MRISGCPDLLKDRLAQDGLFEAAHLSCHGGIPENEELDGTGPGPVETGPCRNIGCARTQGSRSFSTGPTVACRGDGSGVHRPAQTRPAADPHRL